MDTVIQAQFRCQESQNKQAKSLSSTVLFLGRKDGKIKSVSKGQACYDGKLHDLNSFCHILNPFLNSNSYLSNSPKHFLKYLNLIPSQTEFSINLLHLVKSLFSFSSFFFSMNETIIYQVPWILIFFYIVSGIIFQNSKIHGLSLHKFLVVWENQTPKMAQKAFHNLLHGSCLLSIPSNRTFFAPITFLMLLLLRITFFPTQSFSI